MSYWPGKRVYDPRTGRYVGTFVGYRGSAYANVQKPGKQQPESVRLRDIR